MSPRAAWRLEAYEFKSVYDYVPGKADWLAFNLPRQGQADLVGDHLETDVTTCSPRDRVEGMREQIRDHPLGAVVALNHTGIVMGTVDLERVNEADDSTPVEAVMDEGPTTIRPSEETKPLIERMDEADVEALLVTSSDGKLLGFFRSSRH